MKFGYIASSPCNIKHNIFFHEECMDKDHSTIYETTVFRSQMDSQHVFIADKKCYTHVCKDMLLDMLSKMTIIKKC